MEIAHSSPLRQKLTKAQVIEILEKNVSLYQQEDAIHNLVELALYLLEYEYDWTQSEEPTPPNLRPRPEDTPFPPKNLQQNGRLISSIINPAANHPLPKRVCPFCGTESAEAYVCPKCRSLTR